MIKIITTILFTSLVFAQLNIGKVPKEVILHDHLGGKIVGEPFSTKEIRGKVYLFIYVDPDEKGKNDNFFDQIKAKNYDRSKYGSIAVINLAATWLPNFAIESKLKSKQKEYPHTIYVKDKQKIFVKDWELEDDASNILLFDSEGKLLFIKNGVLNQDEINQVISMINERL